MSRAVGVLSVHVMDSGVEYDYYTPHGFFTLQSGYCVAHAIPQEF